MNWNGNYSRRKRRQIIAVSGNYSHHFAILVAEIGDYSRRKWWQL